MSERAVPPPQERIDYYLLSSAERSALLGWCWKHNLIAARVPIDPTAIGYDPTTDEWRVRCFWHDFNGRMVLVGQGDGSEPRTVVLRRRYQAALPWPTAVNDHE